MLLGYLLSESTCREADKHQSLRGVRQGPARGIAAAGYLTYECADDQSKKPGWLDVGEGIRAAGEFVEAITTQFKDVPDLQGILLCFALGFPMTVLPGRQFNKYRVLCLSSLGSTLKLRGSSRRTSTSNRRTILSGELPTASFA